MTGKLLQTYTRKRLAAIARRRHLSGWHDLRKEQLIELLLADGYSPNEKDGDEHNRTNEQTLRDPRPQPVRTRLLCPGVAVTDRITAAVAAPHWIRAEWNVSPETLRRVEAALGPARLKATAVLRLYDLERDDELTTARTRVSDSPIPPEAREWFVPIDQPGHTYQLDLGILADDGEFLRIVSSGSVELPRLEPGPPEVWNGSRGLSRVLREFSPSTVTPGAVHADVDVEVLLRGVVDAGNSVSLAGQRLDLNAGRFEVRQALADGRVVLPVIVTSPCGRIQQTVVVAVERHTRWLEPHRVDSHWSV